MGDGPPIGRVEFERFGVVSSASGIANESYAVWVYPVHAATRSGTFMTRFGIVEVLSLEGYTDSGQTLYGDMEQHGEDIVDAPVIASGEIKFDGCCNWSTDDGCAMHFCDPAGAVDFGGALAEAYRLARPFFENPMYEVQDE